MGKRQKERIKAGRRRGAINQRRGAPEEQTTGTGRAPERPEAPEAAPVPGTRPEAGAEAAGNSGQPVDPLCGRRVQRERPH